MEFYKKNLLEGFRTTKTFLGLYITKSKQHSQAVVKQNESDIFGWKSQFLYTILLYCMIHTSDVQYAEKLSTMQ